MIDYLALFHVVLVASIPILIGFIWLLYLLNEINKTLKELVKSVKK